MHVLILLTLFLYNIPTTTARLAVRNGYIASPPPPPHFTELLKFFNTRQEWMSLMTKFIPSIDTRQWNAWDNDKILKVIAKPFNDLQMQVESGQDKPANAVSLTRTMNDY